MDYSSKKATSKLYLKSVYLQNWYHDITEYSQIMVYVYILFRLGGADVGVLKTMVERGLLGKPMTQEWMGVRQSKLKKLASSITSAIMEVNPSVMYIDSHSFHESPTKTICEILISIKLFLTYNQCFVFGLSMSPSN